VFYILSKVLDWLLSPLSWALLLLVWAMLARARPARSLVLTALAAAILVAFSSEFVAHRLQWAAERDVRSTYRPDVVYDAVVVLGGMVDVVVSRNSGEVELDEHADRIVRAWDLLRDGRARNVVLSAGNAAIQAGQPTEAELLARLLVRWGVAADRIVVEPRSRNTHENAVESAKIAAARGWKTLLVVTSAYHMPRALGCFRALGLEPDTLAVDRRAAREYDWLWLPRADALDRSVVTLRELAGRIVYRAAGFAR
jgi:uncharacterized SAM-binding protein YcdF (DUF218 family)